MQCQYERIDIKAVGVSKFFIFFSISTFQFRIHIDVRRRFNKPFPGLRNFPLPSDCKYGYSLLCVSLIELLCVLLIRSKGYS